MKGRGKHALVCENSGQIIPCIRVDTRVEDSLVVVVELINTHAGRIQLFDSSTVKACTLEARDSSYPMMREGKQRLYVQVSKTKTVPMEIEAEEVKEEAARKKEEQSLQRKRGR